MHDNTNFQFQGGVSKMPLYIWDAYNIEDKVIASKGFPIIDLMGIESDYAKFIKMYLMQPLTDRTYMLP